MYSLGTVKGLKCRECGRTYETVPLNVCEFCFGPLDIEYDYERIRKLVTRKRIQKGPNTLWRYRELLPVEGQACVDLGAGMTPLQKAERLGKELGLKNLYIKNDSMNPTYSFKDRVVSVAITKAREFGFDTVACASTGNLANAVAAHAARAGMRCFVFIPHDLEEGKIIATSVYEPNIVAVRGNYDDVNRLCSQISDKYRWAFVNINIRPYYAEGSKTLAFETAEQLGWKAPDHAIVPMASGSLLTKIHRGFGELVEIGLIKTAETAMHGAQAEGCSPIVTAYRNNTDIIRPVKPDTIAKSLAIGSPADGYYALKTIIDPGGAAEAVEDDEIVAGMKLLARTEGIFTETAGGVTIAALGRLAEKKTFKPADRVVAYVTGLGFKTIEPLTGKLKPSFAVEPSLRAFEEKIGKADLHPTNAAR
ncbi:MAG: threonine synthase [bacterium]